MCYFGIKLHFLFVYKVVMKQWPAVCGLTVRLLVCLWPRYGSLLSEHLHNLPLRRLSALTSQNGTMCRKVGQARSGELGASFYFSFSLPVLSSIKAFMHRNSSLVTCSRTNSWGITCMARHRSNIGVILRRSLMRKKTRNCLRKHPENHKLILWNVSKHANNNNKYE